MDETGLMSRENYMPHTMAGFFYAYLPTVAVFIRQLAANMK